MPFERQFRDFGEAIAGGRKPLVAGEQGYQALELVDAVYRSCRTGEKVVLGGGEVSTIRSVTLRGFFPACSPAIRTG